MARKKNSSSSKKRRTNAKSKTTRGGTRSRRGSNKRSRKKRSSRKRSQQQIKLDRQQKALMGGIAIVVITGVLVLSLLSPNQGQLTSALSSLMKRLFGLGSAALPLVTGGIGVYLILWGMDQPAHVSPFRLTGAALLFIVLETAASLWLLVRPNVYLDVWSIARDGSGGGYFGGLITYALTESIGTLGAIFTLMVLVIVGAILVSGLTREQMSDYLQRSVAWTKEKLAQLREPAPREIPINNGRPQTAPKRETAVVQPALLPETDSEDTEEETPPQPAAKPKRSTRRPEAKPAPPPEDPTVVTPITLGNRGASRQHKWQLPALAEILEPGSDQDGSSTVLREQVETIEHTLDSFGAPATVVEINQGPTITQFGVEPNFIETRSGKRTKVKVGKIAGLADDLALALAAASIRIQAPVPGKGYVGIEVPNPAKALVSLRDVMETADFQKIAKKSLLAIGLGQDVGGQPIVADLTQMPHLLIAGTTGSGKSVCVNSIIACLLLRNTPDTLKLVMVDPKRVELTGYNGIPHLAAPVIVEIDKVIGMLQWALREMDNRYKMFAEVGARNITDYNKKVRRHRKLEPLPYVVIVIDELADLMMLSPEDTERSITRLAQLARATGIHMVIATQRPSVDVVTGLIKANFPARVAFAVASGTDSRVILDTTGAERLLGQGDMLYQSPDAAAAVRSQGCFVSDRELGQLIAYWQRARRFNVVPAAESVQPRAAAAQPANKPTAKPVRESTQKPAAPQPAAQSTPSPEEKRKPSVAAPRINLDNPDLNEAESAAAPPAQPQQQPQLERPSPPPPADTPKDAPQAQKEPPQQQPLWEALQAKEEEETVPELDDELLPDAIALVRQLNKASTSLLQRRFRIGYTRAARMIDYMEEAGIIGPPTGTSKAREVLPADGDQNGDETAVSDSPSDDA